MYYPRLDQVVELSNRYNLIPVRMTFMADQETPISIFQKVRGNETFLLESVEGGSRWARYSFIGLTPMMVLRAKKQQIEMKYRDGHIDAISGNPIEYLRETLAKFRSPVELDFPRFYGGAVGYFGFDILQNYEELPDAALNDLFMDDVAFMFADQVIVFDHLRQEIQVIGHLHLDQAEDLVTIERKYHECCKQIRTLARKIRDADQVNRNLYALPNSYESNEVQSNVTKERFMQMVEQAKEYIASGDVFQVVLSQRFEIDNPPDPFEVYRVLRLLNPSPYMYFLQFDETEVLVGTSPELLVRVEDGKVENRPIAGTRKRGQNAEEDEELKKDLLADEKERAEHHMLVDLGRNDIGRVARYGTVQVEQFMEVELYSHVMHIVSHVSGRLQDDKDSFNALISCFPAGTVSGAPKLRAMEIIAELEPTARNAYAGAIGYFGFSGNMDSCITIRTVVFKNNKAYVQAGAGIVADSVPEKEFEETENKAKAMIKAVQMAKQIVRLEEDDEHVSTIIK
ncbi:MAG TPA: anthranilate synthase component I [Bacillota bacterium]|nr:anthranilate synthase component I [Bacillota bacterium]